MQTRQATEAVHEALDKVLAELDGVWPVPYPKRKRPAVAQHMVGYSRERGRRPLTGSEL